MCINIRILISILEAIYIIYMFNYFKTRYSLAHPFSYFRSKYLNHPIGYTKEPRNTICIFGKQVSWILGGYLILKSIMFEKKVKFISMKNLILLNKTIMLIVIITSFMNINALIYLMPIFVIEYLI